MPHESFKELKKNLEVKKNLKDAIKTRHSAVRSQLENKLGRVVETKLIGSLQRKTRHHPYGNAPIDIDILLILGNAQQWTSDGMLSHEAHALVEGVLDDTRYSEMGLRTDEPTVTFSYADLLKVEIVPAYRDNIGHCPEGITHEGVGQGYWVASSTGWTLADYDHDAERLTLVNGNYGGRIVPLIKMLKCVRDQYFPKMSSYYLESLVLQVVPTILQDNFMMNYHEVIPRFFELSQPLLGTPLKMSNVSNSQPATLEESDIEGIIEAFQVISGFLHQIELKSSAQQRQAWKKLFQTPFPL